MLVKTYVCVHACMSAKVGAKVQAHSYIFSYTHIHTLIYGEHAGHLYAIMNLKESTIHTRAHMYMLFVFMSRCPSSHKFTRSQIHTQMHAHTYTHIHTQKHTHICRACWTTCPATGPPWSSTSAPRRRPTPCKTRSKGGWRNAQRACSRQLVARSWWVKLLCYESL